MAEISISIDDSLLDRIREQSGPQGVSRFLADAAERQLRREALRAYAAEATAVNGPPSPEAVAEVQAWFSSATQRS